MSQEKVELRPIPQLFSDSWKVFTISWKEYLLYYVGLLLGLFVIMGVTFGYPIVSLVMSNPTAQDLTPEMFFSQWPFFVLAVVLFAAFSSLISLAMAKTIYSKAAGQKVTIKEAFSYATKNFLSYLGVSLVAGLIIVLGFVLLVIPGFYALIALSLLSVVFVVEEVHSLTALKRSRELVNKNFWGVTGRIIVLFVIIALLSAVTERMPLVQTILNFITSAITIPYIYFLHQDLVK